MDAPEEIWWCEKTNAIMTEGELERCEWVDEGLCGIYGEPCDARRYALKEVGDECK